MRGWRMWISTIQEYLLSKFNKAAGSGLGLSRYGFLILELTKLFIELSYANL